MAKKILCMCLILSLFVTSNPAITDAKTKVKISKKKITLQADTKKKLKITGTKKKVKWYNSNTSCLQLKGMLSHTVTLKGLKPGTAIVTAKVGKKKYKCKVKVTKSANCLTNKHRWLIIKRDILNATCTKPQHVTRVCLDCNKKENATITVPHDIHVQDQEPTCIDKGYHREVCVLCGQDIVYKEFDKLPHNYYFDIIKEPSKTDARTAEDFGEAYLSCKNCHQTFGGERESVIRINGKNIYGKRSSYANEIHDLGEKIFKELDIDINSGSWGFSLSGNGIFDILNYISPIQDYDESVDIKGKSTLFLTKGIDDLDTAMNTIFADDAFKVSIENITGLTYGMFIYDTNEDGSKFEKYFAIKITQKTDNDNQNTTIVKLFE